MMGVYIEEVPDRRNEIYNYEVYTHSFQESSHHAPRPVFLPEIGRRRCWTSSCFI